MRLRSSHLNVLPLLLCAVLSSDQGSVLLPSSKQCQEILFICALFEKAKATCHEMGTFLRIPPTLLGRIARSTSCTLAPRSCIALAVFCAVSCPACLILAGGSLGDFYGSNIASLDLEDRRVVCFSVSLPHPSFRPLCELCPAKGTSVVLYLRDSPTAASKSPLLISELRAVLFRRKNRRYVRRWYAHFDMSAKVLPRATGDASAMRENVQLSLLLSAFSDPHKSAVWREGFLCLKQWMSGVISRRTWNSAHEAARREMIESCRCCLSDAVQHVLLHSHRDAPLTTPGVFVYALFSPLWGKCYVGAVGFGKSKHRCPLDRWIEHTKQALLWSSKTSRKRYSSARSPLYAAMAAVGPANVIQVILAQPSAGNLAPAEKYFIRKLSPVFNIREVDDSIVQLAKSLSPITIDDFVTYGNRLLRQSRPCLTASQWACVIAEAASSGDRALAAKLARHARTTCSKAKKLRALPQILIPCAVPAPIIATVQTLLKSALLQIPGFQRLPQFTIQLQVGRACWAKTPAADSVLAPAFPKKPRSLLCKCQRFDVNKVLGHVCLRQWSILPPCKVLSDLVGTSSLAYRTFPSTEVVVIKVRHQAVQKLQQSGMPKDAADQAADVLAQTLQPALERYWATLPKQTILSNLKEAAIPIYNAGFMFVRIDRNPGRLILLCPSLWFSLQKSTFLQSPRYRRTTMVSSADDADFCKNTIASFAEFMYRQCSARVRLRESTTASRPRGYFTIKQKSLILQLPAIIKVRPIISHFLHPCRAFLRRVARALGILAFAAAKAVHEAKGTHLPIWQMHHGTRRWLELLAKQSNLSRLVEFDVEDCFLNTPRELVIPALRFWTEFGFKRGRRARYFAISKDSKNEDYLGRPCSTHFWELSSEMVIAAVEWELEHNACFEVCGEDGGSVVLKQEKGLPIGGHLSAALVELVALHRELLQPNPACLSNTLSARYRDNYFLAIAAGNECQMNEAASQLSELLSMPVKPVGGAPCARFLETFISFNENGIRCILGFRTDSDRQGESGDVESWPPAFDPRAKMLLPGLIMGIVSKLRFYAAPEVGGFTATIRRIYQFLKARGYPTRWWLRPLAVAFVRVGVAVPCLPRLLRYALTWPPESMRHQSSRLQRTI